MPFTGIVDPEQLDVWSKVLNDHCASCEIEPYTPEYENAGYLVMSLFMNGAQTVEELKAPLEVALAGDEGRRA